MTKALSRYKQGDFNHAIIEVQPDGSQIITLMKDGVKATKKFRVRDIYGPNEEEVDIDTGKPIA